MASWVFETELWTGYGASCDPRFDGDRVLVLQDGNRVGGLGFESGDHAEPVNVLTVERIEIVKGPATLLYGSNAIGGVVNAITGHDARTKELTVT